MRDSHDFSLTSIAFNCIVKLDICCSLETLSLVGFVVGFVAVVVVAVVDVDVDDDDDDDDDDADDDNCFAIVFALAAAFLSARCFKYLAFASYYRHLSLCITFKEITILALSSVF
jgi:hypothetical protein